MKVADVKLTGLETVIHLNILAFGKKFIILLLIMANSPQLEAGRYGGTYVHKDIAFEFIWKT